jgi:hypothetical protein
VPEIDMGSPRRKTLPPPVIQQFETFDELALFVHKELCDLDLLERSQSPLKQLPLTRRGRICGIVFSVAGPRQLRTSCIWSTDEGRLLFYDSTGHRVRDIRLSESPDVPQAAGLATAA